MVRRAPQEEQHIALRHATTIAAVAVALALTPALAATPAENDARILGMAYNLATSCGRPTAPIEAALERYITRIGAGPLQAQHLRQEMLQQVDWQRTLGMGKDCTGVDKSIDALITPTTLAPRR